MITADLSPNVRQSMLNAIRVAVDEKIGPRAAEIDRVGEFPEDVRRLWSDLGLMGLMVPETYGGIGAPLDFFCDVVIEIAMVCANSANILTQQALASSPILLAGTEEQKQRWLPRVASGNSLAAFALTEENAGSDVRAIRTTAKLNNGSYYVNGSKIFCTWGSIADVLTVFVKRDEGGQREQLIALVVELPCDGVTVSRLEKKMGLNGSPTAQLTFDDVRVPVGNRLGEEGGGFEIAMHCLNSGRVEIGALALGIARGAIDYASRYLSERKQFGAKLSSYQGLRFKVAGHITELAAAYFLLVEAARELDRAAPHGTTLSSMAKLFATDVAMEVVVDAVGLLGGYGYLQDFPLERMMRDVKLMQIVEGTNEIQRSIIAKQWFTEIENGIQRQGWAPWCQS